MLARRLGWITFLLAVSSLTATAAAASRCKLTLSKPLPVRMDNLRPVVSANINGVDAWFMIDTGSFFDFLSPAVAAQFKLPLRYAPPWYSVRGVGGSFVPKIAIAKTFTIAGVTAHDAQFLVGNNDLQGGIAGILGQNLLRIADVDYDFADGLLRFAKPRHCGDDVLAYWATTQPIGVVDLHWTSERRPHPIAKASINGRDINVLFDTGSARTILSLSAAKRAGITPGSPGVIPAGKSFGLGGKTVNVWIAPVDKFEIGGETIEHTHVLIGDIGLQMVGADMLLGSDFFLAHHIYVAYSQDKLYFTYNGGPVFDLNTRHQAQPAAAAKVPVGNTPATAAQPGIAPGAGLSARSGDASAPSGALPVSDVPTDAAGFMRRGMAEASRREYVPAIADFTRACGLPPSDAECLYQRGLAYWHSAQPQPALADFNAAIQLQPNDFDAHFARAQLALSRRSAGADADLDAVDRLAPQQADLRLRLGQLYAAAGEYAGAVHQYDLWIEYHPNDIRLPYALSSRCGSEAAANVDVDRALDDCSTALRLARKSTVGDGAATTLSNRGLAYLRQGRLDSALADLDAALKLRPRFPMAQYERGLVELKRGRTAEGRADLAAAQAQRPGLAERLAKIGLKP